MNNYEFCAQWAARVGGKVLDYGCGDGQVVKLMRDAGLDAYGCDVFFEGADFSPKADPEHLLRMDGNRIPFPDGSFDAVVSNQVIEHVPDLDLVNAEIARVLKPGGRCLHVFPHRGVWFEAHIKVPFVHRFRKGASWRVYWVKLCRFIRYGRIGLTQNAEKVEWIDKWTHYRSRAEIHRAFATRFTFEHIESEWFDARTGAVWLPAFAKRLIARKLAGVVIELSKR